MPTSEQAEAEQLRQVLAEVQAANERLAAQREERRRAAQDLLAKSQVGCPGYAAVGSSYQKLQQCRPTMMAGCGVPAMQAQGRMRFACLPGSLRWLPRREGCCHSSLHNLSMIIAFCGA